jgi:NAD+ synthase
MDVCLYGKNQGVPAAEVAAALDLPLEQVEHAYRDIEAKRAVAAYLHARPMLIEGAVVTASSFTAAISAQGS